MATSQDDALIFLNNPADASITPDYDTIPGEDPTGGRSHDHQHHTRPFDSPRLQEQPREQLQPLPRLHEPPTSKRVPLTQLTPRTRQRDRDLYRAR